MTEVSRNGSICSVGNAKSRVVRVTIHLFSLCLLVPLRTCRTFTGCTALSHAVRGRRIFDMDNTITFLVDLFGRDSDGCWRRSQASSPGRWIGARAVGN